MQVKDVKVSQPAYATLERYIGEKVESGRFAPGQRIGTTAEIAKKLGLSSSTVRYSLQSLTAKGLLVRRPGLGTFISNNVQKEDEKADIKNHNNTSISLLLPDISVPEYAHLARGIQDAAFEHNLDLVVTSTDDKIDNYDAVIRRHIESNVLGFIMVPPRHCPLSMETLHLIHTSNVFGVSCYRPTGYANWPVVMTDRFTEIKNSVYHLHAIGKKKIAFISGAAQDNEGYFFDKSSFIEGLLDCGLSVYRELFSALNVCDLKYPIVSTSKIVSLTEEKLAPWLKENDHMDAICCSDDTLAIAAIKILKRAGKKVPQDVAVIGQGNFGEFVGLPQGELSTVDGAFNEVGKMACQLLLENKQGKEFPHNHVVKLVGDLVIGKSTVVRG